MTGVQTCALPIYYKGAKDPNEGELLRSPRLQQFAALTVLLPSAPIAFVGKGIVRLGRFAFTRGLSITFAFRRLSTREELASRVELA